MNARIEAVLTANNAGFTAALNNSSTQVSKLEQQMRRAGALPLPGERSARESAEVFARQADSADKVTSARYRSMDAAKAEESAIRATIRAREDEASANQRAADTARNAAAAAANIRANRDLESSFARPGAPRPGAGAAAVGAPGMPADDGSFTAWRKRFMASAGGIGAGELVKGAGIGALVAGFRAALNNAQQLRKEARELGNDLAPSVAAAARMGDAFDRVKGATFSFVNKLVEIPVDAVDGLVAAAGALAGLGSVSDNLAAIQRDPEVERARAEKARAEQQAKATAAAKAEADFQTALAELEAARVEALKEGLTTQQQIALAEDMVRLAKEDILHTQADTVEAARAEKDLVERQAELARLRRDREAEIADEKQRALEIQKRGEEAVTAEKEKQLAKEEQIARAREQAAARVAAAEAKVAAARQAYAAALSDQSAASLSEVQAGTRGSPEDQRRAAEVARLRDRAREARDRGALAVVGGQTVSVADQLSTRANQVQSSIQSLNTAERDPLGAVTEQLKQANEELAQIRESLESVSV